MEFSNCPMIIGVSLGKQQHLSSSEHLFVDIVLIDQSHDVLSPLLYQWHSTSLKQEMSACIEKESFLMIGEVLSIDKGKKLIYLTNNRTVNYRHLIVVSGLKQGILRATHDRFLKMGVSTLFEALRVRKNFEELQIFPKVKEEIHKNHLAKTLLDADVPLIAAKKILKYHTEHKSLGLTLSKTLYQVQL